MINGRILPWTQDHEAEGYPVWTDWEAVQRTVFFLNTMGEIDTSFNITPYDPNSPEDFTYIKNLILELRDPPQYNLITVPHDYPTIQAGIDAAFDGDTVLVSPGTYVENINFNGKNIIVGSLFLTTQDTSYISQTIIDGDEAGSGVTFNNNENLNAILIGFTVTNGFATHGGGIHCEYSSPLLEHLIIYDNLTNHGGGIYCFEASPIIRNVIILNNISMADGGGITLHDNSHPDISNSIFSNNYAEYGGGAIRALPGNNFSLSNCLIYENESGYGGAIYLWDSSVEVVNSTIINNSSSFLHIRGYFDIKIINSIIREHLLEETLTYYNLHPSSQITFLYNNLDFNEEDINNEYDLEINWGDGNNFEDPNFSDPYFNNYNLEIPSPCIDTGHPDLDGDGFTWEIDPDDRDPDGTRLDMGAFYHHHEAGDFPIPVNYNEGWNMAGLPLSVEDSHYQILFNSIYSGSLYSFDGMYISEEYLTEGVGYLLRFTENTEVVFEGIHLSEINIPVVGGWNLISGISTLIPVNALYSSSIVYPGTVYGFEGTYVNADYIIPGRGYWARVMHDGNIFLSTDSWLMKEIVEQTIQFPEENLVFSNGELSAEIYLKIPEDEKLNYSFSLPPRFSGMEFDIRYSGDWKIPMENQTIHVLNNSGKLNVTFHSNGRNESIILKDESGNLIRVNEGETVDLPNTSQFFTLLKSKEIPEEFTLIQNFPNPFNNKTSIQYYVNGKETVQIDIINLKGEKIITLVNGHQSEGIHQVEWNGTDSNHEIVSSGIYLYKVSAGGKTLSGKCVLLK